GDRPERRAWCYIEHSSRVSDRRCGGATGDPDDRGERPADEERKEREVHAQEVSGAPGEARLDRRCKGSGVDGSSRVCQGQKDEGAYEKRGERHLLEGGTEGAYLRVVRPQGECHKAISELLRQQRTN